MDSCLYMGSMLVFAACVLVAVFRPRETKGRFLCLLLAVMGAMTISLQQDGEFLLAVQIVLGIAMTLCTTGVLLAEVYVRRAAKAAKKYARRHVSDAASHRAVGTASYVQAEQRRAA